MVFKCTHGISTFNVQNSFIFLDDIAQRNTRSNNKKLLRSYRCNTDFYQNTFVNAGIQLWNSFPLHVRFSGSLAEFKRHINYLKA